MGNRHELGNYPPQINPESFPFLHIVKGEKETWEYVQSLRGATIIVGIRRNTGFPVEYAPHANLEIPLLPREPAVVPPSPIDTVSHVEAKLETYGDELDQLVRATNSDIVACSHGSYWGLLPEQQVAKMLRERGHKVSDTFPKIGGRKRIQTHGVLLI